MGIGKEMYDIEKLRYHKIVVMTDADVDGSHIRTLIMTFFFRQMQSLIEKGYLYLAQPPLYLIKKGQAKVYLKNEKELENYLFAKIGDEVVFYNKDFRSEILKGPKLLKFIKLVHKKNLLMNNLEKHGMPRPLTKKLVRTIDSESDFQDKAKVRAIAQQLLLDHAPRFRAGIIVSSGARLRVLPSLFDLIDTNMPGYVEMVDRMGFSPRTAAAVKRPFLEASLEARPEVAHGDFKACDRFDVIGRLSEISVPVLVVSAEDDQLTPPKYAEFLAQRIAAATLAHIPEAGHFVPIEKPLEVNAAICRFLDAHGL